MVGSLNLSGRANQNKGLQDSSGKPFSVPVDIAAFVAAYGLWVGNRLSTTRWLSAAAVMAFSRKQFRCPPFAGNQWPSLGRQRLIDEARQSIAESAVELIWYRISLRRPRQIRDPIVRV